MTCPKCGKKLKNASESCPVCEGKNPIQDRKPVSIISTSQLLKGSWSLFKKVWLTALSITVIGFLIQTVVKKIVFGIFGTYVGVSSLATLVLGKGRFFLSNLLFNLAGLIIIWTAFIVINFWMQTAIVFAIRNQQVANVFEAIKNALKQSWRAIGPISIISLLTSLLTGLGFVFFIIPGILLSIVWQFATLAFVIDGKRGMDALNHSWHLVMPRFWGVLGRNLILVLAVVVASLFLNKGFLGLIRGLIITPFWVVFSYCLYEDLKKVATSK